MGNLSSFPPFSRSSKYKGSTSTFPAHLTEMSRGVYAHSPEGQDVENTKELFNEIPHKISNSFYSFS